ncbi:MAG: triose-phosphate isomerase [Candidatus Ranarchaeia archaeon]
MTTLKLPIIVVNLKGYEQTYGADVIKFAKISENIMKETGVTIVLCPQHTDIFRVSQTSEIPVFAQHVDAIKPGRGTGHILPEAVKEAGAVGTLLNHSERRLTIAEIDTAIHRCKKTNLESLVCSNNAPVSAAIAALDPTFVAVEPPELIGTGVSVSTAKPEVVTNTVKRIREVNKNVQILTGAGISSPHDLQAAIELGTIGVLIASSITKAREPETVLMSFAEALTETG